jgi:AcrR family transcriptional regulator
MERSPSWVSGPRPGGHQLRREVIVHHQRERILAAAVDLVAERGYRSISVADIVKRAAIARAKFYENFSSKEDCFLAAYDRGSAEAVARVAEACESSVDEFPERVHSGIAALLEFMASNPALTRACIIEAPAVGGPVEGRLERALLGFAALLKDGRKQAPEAELPETVEDSVLGGLYWLVYDAVLTGEPKDVGDLLPSLTEFSLTPFLGAEDARRIAEQEPADLSTDV